LRIYFREMAYLMGVLERTNVPSLSNQRCLLEVPRLPFPTSIAKQEIPAASLLLR
jgi:hypothetical protein